MDRGSSKYNQAFVLYNKIQDRPTFANDIIINHPDIVNGLKLLMPPSQAVVDNIDYVFRELKFKYI